MVASGRHTGWEVGVKKRRTDQVYKRLRGRRLIKSWVVV